MIYQTRLISFSQTYIWDSIREFHLIFHQTQIITGVDDVMSWQVVDCDLKTHILKHRPLIVKASSSTLKSASVTVSFRVCFKYNNSQKCWPDCYFHHVCAFCSKSHTDCKKSALNLNQLLYWRQWLSDSVTSISESFLYRIVNTKDEELIYSESLKSKDWAKWLLNHSDQLYVCTLIEVI